MTDMRPRSASAQASFCQSTAFAAAADAPKSRPSQSRTLGSSSATASAAVRCAIWAATLRS
jgi:hypothetical protein